MRRIEYYLKETAAALRRNGIVAFAAMSTAFIALFLLGFALLIAREFALIKDAWTGNVEVAVYLQDPVKPEVVADLTDRIQGLPAVAPGGVTYEDKAAACERFKSLFANQPVFLENVDCNQVIPTSLRVHLSDPSRFDEITAALGCEVNEGKMVCKSPGVLQVADFHTILQRLTAITNVLKFGVIAIALIMLVSALFLIANTLRMGMFARRKEIGIMRLVGATNWRIRTPFLIEGLVEALLGAFAAVLALLLLKVVFIDRLRGEISYVPLIRNADVLAIVPVIVLAAAGVSLIAGWIGMRRFLDV
jgi:cell division transport system permease protein